MGGYAEGLERRILLRLEQMERRIMSGLDDLNANIAKLQAEEAQLLADITTALKNDDPDAAVEAAAQLVSQATANLAAGDPLTQPAPPSGS